MAEVSTTGDDCDLLVVGAGAAGLAAAVTAAFHGLRVIVAEKDAVCGGATAWSCGAAGRTEWPPCAPGSAARSFEARATTST